MTGGEYDGSELSRYERSLRRRIKWGERFAGYVPAAQANAVGGEDGVELLWDAALDFREVWPDCPYSTDWLVLDFLKRI